MSAEPNTFSLIGTLAGVTGGLGIFLLGMKQISDGLQAVAGRRMRKLIAAATTTRAAGIITGATVTAIIQSSSITTVMVVGFVSSGVMTLLQAINVIIGANIGTTATAWIVSFFPKIGETFVLGLTGISAIVYLFAYRERWKYIGLSVLGLALIFYGLIVMDACLTPLSKQEGFVNLLAAFEAHSAWGLIKCIIVGAIFTAIIQSSSAATAISIGLAVKGIISFETAASLVLGMNIGTTVTAWLAALGAPTEARRAALAHTLFNMIGVIIMAPFFLTVILPAIGQFYAIEPEQAKASLDIGKPIAMVHTLFNLANTIIFFPFIPLFAKLIRRLIPDSTVRETPRLAILHTHKLAPVAAVEQARKEVEFMARRAEASFVDLRRLLTGEESEELEQNVFKIEEELDTVQHEVSTFLGAVMANTLPSDVALRARMLLRVADEYESVTDETAGLLKQLIRIRKNNMKLSDRGREQLLKLHDRCYAFFLLVSEGFRQGKDHARTILGCMNHEANELTIFVKDIRAAQMTRLAERDATIDPLCMVVMLDMLNLYRRTKDDCLNIGEAMLDELNGR